MRLAVTHLTSLGHTRIAYLTCAPGIYLSRDKLDAFFEAMHAAGLAVRREYIVEGRDFNERTGYSSMNRLLNLQERPTAVIAINDLTAAGALQAIVHSGYRVPDDFSLLSFDNSFIAGLMTPSITGLDYRYDAYGRMLIDTALGAIKEKKPQGVTRVQPTLVIKDSCRKV
jgi:LacI family transcriptional regulator